MLDAIAAYVELVQGDHIFGEVVSDAVVDPEFPVDGLRGGKQVDGQQIAASFRNLGSMGAHSK